VSDPTAAIIAASTPFLAAAREFIAASAQLSELMLARAVARAALEDARQQLRDLIWRARQAGFVNSAKLVALERERLELARAIITIDNAERQDVAARERAAEVYETRSLELASAAPGAETTKSQRKGTTASKKRAA
jgi:hypothetical protein